MTLTGESKPKAIDIQTYAELLLHDFRYLVTYKPDQKVALHELMEMNPCLVPGARSEKDFLPSNQGPERGALITHPELPGYTHRQPDFMWLAFDSLNFTPVLVLVDTPSKKYFDENGTLTVDFSQAKNQLNAWRAAMNQAKNISEFYKAYDISESLRKMNFSPIYLLIYGREEEFENSTPSKIKLVDQELNEYLMPFDSLGYDIRDTNLITTFVKNGKFFAKYVSPTFKLGRDEMQLRQVDEIANAADRMGYATSDRRAFLMEQISHRLKENGSDALEIPFEADEV